MERNRIYALQMEQYEALEALERFLPVLFWAHVTLSSMPAPQGPFVQGQKSPHVLRPWDGVGAPQLVARSLAFFWSGSSHVGLSV